MGDMLSDLTRASGGGNSGPEDETSTRQGTPTGRQCVVRILMASYALLSPRAATEMLADGGESRPITRFGSVPVEVALRAITTSANGGVILAGSPYGSDSYLLDAMIDPSYATGILLALVAAVANAVNYLSVRVGTSEGRTMDAVTIVLVVNIVVLGPIVAVLYYPDYGIDRVSLLAFVGSGIFGTLLGRAFSYLGIDRIGASRAAPIFSSNAIIASILGVVLLGETLTSFHAVGIVLVVAGAAGISWETTQENPDDLPRRELLLGLVFPVLAAFAYGVDPIFARVGLEAGTPPAVGLVIKLVTAIAGFSLYLLWESDVPAPSTFRVSNSRWFLLAGVANTLFLLSFYSALDVAPVSVVAPVMISYTFFVVVISALFVPQHLERITWRLVVAALFVVAGLVLITAFA